MIPGARLGLFPMVAMTIVLLMLSTTRALAQLSFEQATDNAGLGFTHDFDLDQPSQAPIPMPLVMSGGVAAGDFDRDGDTDLYLVTGNAYPNALLRNNGSGQFVDVAASAGVALEFHQSNGPVMADIDGDGWLDLLAGGAMGSGMRVFRNKGDGRFEDVTTASGIHQEALDQTDWSSAFGDPDGDGDLDLYVGHWGAETPITHLWSNNGAGTFSSADTYAGIDAIYSEHDWTFAPGFADFTGDGLQDLVITSDFETSHTLENRGGMQFENTTTEVIDDRAGMGSSIGDFDNDGDLDWFVTAIWWDQGREGEGNRLYENDGSGQFSNVTETAGVLEGDWGWGACTQDFNNDGWLDLFHVNGMIWDNPEIDYQNDRSRLFMNDGDGTFTERALDLGIEDFGMGRGVVCFDADGDGDIDIFTSNTLGKSQFYRNTLANNPGWLQVSLQGEPSNPSAIGAVISLRTGETWQMRELRVGSHYLSQDPLLQHFGLGGADRVDELRVSWPHGGETVLTSIEPNQRLALSALEADPPPFALQPGMTAAWYDPTHDGEGFLLEMLDGGLVVLYWFTYDGEGHQDWYVAVGRQHGRRLLFNQLLRMSGGEFGDGFDPARVESEVVGTAAFTFTSCDTGFMDWSIGDAMGRQELVRLTRVAGLDCGPTAKQASVTGSGLSGSWYDPSHDGEGFVLEVLPDGRALAYWFSYSPDGDRRWFFGLGDRRDGEWVFDTMLTPSGGVFGEAFDPSTVEAPRWGRLQLGLDCSGGEAIYDSDEDGFGAGNLQLTRLSRPASIACDGP